MLIAFCGKAGAGKDTAAEVLVNQYGFRRYAMAGPLKRMLASIGIVEPHRELKELPLPGFDFSYRKAAQVLGTEWGRAVDPELWVKLTMQEYRSSSQPMVISDLRFVNEAQMVRALGGCIIRISGLQSDLGTNANHASEEGLPATLVDFELSNTTTISDFRLRVSELARKLHLEEVSNAN